MPLSSVKDARFCTVLSALITRIFLAKLPAPKKIISKEGLTGEFAQEAYILLTAKTPYSDNRKFVNHIDRTKRERIGFTNAVEKNNARKNYRQDKIAALFLPLNLPPLKLHSPSYYPVDSKNTNSN